jgi:hypothetical protein
VVVVVLVAASPIAIAAVSLVGDTWHPVGDWASMLYRTSRVGTTETPLVGAYTVKGWAHPGPFLYWAAAPLYRLTGGDTRSLEWTAAIINVATVAAIGAVAWRRGRFPLLAAMMLLVAVLVRGIEPGRLVDLWNPYVGLLPFLLVVLLAWDAALGRPRSLLWAAIPASIAIQSHVAFAALVALVALWLAAWTRWWPHLVERAVDRDGLLDVRPASWSWHAWRPAALGGLAIAAVLWLPALVDLVADTHNLASVVGHLVVGSGTQIGITHGGSLVSRYVRPDGPWIGGGEPSVFFSTQGSGPVPVFLMLAALVGCVVVARRRRLVDAAALSTLAVALVAGSVFAAANLVAPAFDYLTQWLKVIGGLAWFTLAWTAWRVAEPYVRSVAARRVAAGAAVSGLVLAAAAWSWADATQTEPPVSFEGEVVQALRLQLRESLPLDQTYRVEQEGDVVSHNGPGVLFYMVEDGYDVVTRDGAKGLKWGHEHRYDRGDHYDVRLTVAVHYGGSWRDAYASCLDDPDVELVASYDQLDPAERDELGRLKDESFFSPDTYSADDEARTEELVGASFRAGVFAGEHGCGQEDDDEEEEMSRAG